ncbi:MAG: class A beta-lactamase [Alphaproteobacteria bacterium]|nr:class A beta-lactamase [Alphaproteobacteria bacterium]
MTTRRNVLAGSVVTLAASCMPATTFPKFATGVDAKFAAIEATLRGGRLGVCAIDTGSGARIEHRAGERFAMCSTFKWLLAAAILKRSESGQLPLDQRVLYGANDLLAYAPVTTAHVADGMTVAQLCEAAVTVSDNTAANLLLPGVGGPDGLTQFIREHGDNATQLQRNEPTLNENAAGDPRDTTTPEAMAGLLQRLVVGDALREDSRETLAHWMESASTGLDKLRAGLPSDWRVGDKTGSGGNGASNDVAVAWPPGRKPLVIACYTSEGDADAKIRALAMAAVGRLVAEQLT